MHPEHLQKLSKTTIEKECLAIVFTAERFEEYILGKEKVKVFFDHKPLETIPAKPIYVSPKRLQWMRLRLQKYSLDVKYKPGPQMYISDTLSRVSLPTAQAMTEDNCTIFQLQEQELIRNLSNINMEDTLFVTDHRLSQIQEENSHDTTLQTLIKVTKKGWPENKNDSPLNIREYWPYHDELFSENGLAYGSSYQPNLDLR